MEKNIKDRYNEAIFQEALQCYAISSDQAHALDGFESFIYEFERESKDYILRIGHSGRRSEALIRGEVDWINYLQVGGAGVSRAILSQNGSLVESINDGHGGQFLATAFVKAQGKPPWEFDRTPTYFETYGRLLGRMHALTKDYRPTRGALRPQWDDPVMQDVEANLPTSEALTLQKYNTTMSNVKDLPKDRDNFGLIHFDAHEGNLFLDQDGKITIFDFDDCNYNWFSYDIAIVLFYNLMGAKDIFTDTREFMKHFLRGYQQENKFDPTWLEQIPFFLKMREIDLYAVIHRSFDVENLDDPWCERYMQGRKQGIENDVPYLDFDFTSLGVYLD